VERGKDEHGAGEKVAHGVSESGEYWLKSRAFEWGGALAALDGSMALRPGEGGKGEKEGWLGRSVREGRRRTTFRPETHAQAGPRNPPRNPPSRCLFQCIYLGARRRETPGFVGGKGNGGEGGGSVLTMLSCQTHGVVFVQVTGRPVVVKLNTGVDYKGVLACLDGYMNIAMEQVGSNHSTPPPHPSSNCSPPHPFCPREKGGDLHGSPARPRAQVAHACMRACNKKS
jgi:hypothetical protein